MSSKVTQEGVNGLMLFSCLIGIGVGLVSLIAIPWYAAIGVAVLGDFFCFMVIAMILSIEPIRRN